MFTSFSLYYKTLSETRRFFKAMDIETQKTLLLVCFAVSVILMACVINFRIMYLRQKQKNYFLRRDRERYAETIHASKDGYFAFIYPDDFVKDPVKTVREQCSRRLAVMLDLKNGRDSSFEDVLNALYKNDSKKLEKYLKLMQEEGLAFEDTFMVKSTKRGIRIMGNRIHGSDNNLYCDMIWFRDLSDEQLKIETLEQELKKKSDYIKDLEDLIDNLKTPVYIKNEHKQITSLNKKYADLIGTTRQDYNAQNQFKKTWEELLTSLTNTAIETNQPQTKHFSMVVNGNVRYYEVTETPFHNADKLDGLGIVGQMIDVTELNELKRQFKIYQDTHLSVLSALGTAFAIYDMKSKLVFYNKSFLDMWHFKAEDMEEQMSYGSFLEILRNKRLLPDVSDFKAYKDDEEKLFETLIEPKENLLYLPDGRTIRRLVVQHPNGLVFAYEDVSDRLKAERTIHELTAVQNDILDALNEAVLIFSTSGELKYYNQAYIKLFQTDETKLKTLSRADDVFEFQKPYFTKVENWDNLKKHMSTHIFEIVDVFRLIDDYDQIIEVSPHILANDTILVQYIKNNKK